MGPVLHDHLLTVSVQSVVDDPLGRVDRMVVRKSQMPETLGDGGEAGAFGLMIEAVVRVRAVEAPCSKLQGIFDPQGRMFILIAR
jgi:hypothetical protein